MLMQVVGRVNLNYIMELKVGSTVKHNNGPGMYVFAILEPFALCGWDDGFVEHEEAFKTSELTIVADAVEMSEELIELIAKTHRGEY